MSERPMKRIPIAAAERIAKAYGYDQVIVYARRTGDGDPHGEHVTTYGVDKAHCSAAAKIGDALKKFLGWGVAAPAGPVKCKACGRVTSYGGELCGDCSEEP